MENWKTLQTQIKDSNNQTVKSRSHLRGKTLEHVRSVRTVRIEVNKEKPTEYDKMMRLAQLTHEHRIRFGKRHSSVKPSESAVSLKIRRDMEKRSEMDAEEALKSMRFKQSWQ